MRTAVRLEALEDRRLLSYDFSTLDFPGAARSSAFGVNNAGQIVGQYLDNSFVYHGFLDVAGNLTNIDPPGSTTSQSLGISDAGQIVGDFGMGNPYRTDGYLDVGGGS